jgi:hypothetical protein
MFGRSVEVPSTPALRMFSISRSGPSEKLNCRSARPLDSAKW